VFKLPTFGTASLLSSAKMAVPMLQGIKYGLAGDRRPFF